MDMVDVAHVNLGFHVKIQDPLLKVWVLIVLRQGRGRERDMHLYAGPCTVHGSRYWYGLTKSGT